MNLKKHDIDKQDVLIGCFIGGLTILFVVFELVFI